MAKLPEPFICLKIVVVGCVIIEIVTVQKMKKSTIAETHVNYGRKIIIAKDNMKKIGICFGGYCPLHQGHMDVIMKAKKENDICYVIVCGYDNEPRGWEINLNLFERYCLIKNFFKDDEQIRVRRINDTQLGLDESMSDNNWKVWQEKVKEYIDYDGVLKNEYATLGSLGTICCSNEINWYVAEPYYKTCIERNNILAANVILVDKVNQVSGTLIRNNPVKYWNKITEPFKPYLCKNVLVIGTASEGKSTLVKDISRYFDIPYAEEYGRTYMEEHKIDDRKLTEEIFEEFLFGQIQRCDDERKKSKNGVFISDTDNTVTLMYALAYTEDKKIKVTKKDYEKLHKIAEGINEKNKFKWDHIFIFPPSKDFVDDGCRYMEQASMEERNKNFMKLQKLVNEFYPEVSKTYLNGSFLENFNAVKNYINSLIEG